MTHLGAHFENPRSIQTDAQNAMHMVAGLGDLHRMTVVLSAENAPLRARLMVMRAAGGMKMQIFAATRPKWQFVGIYPSRAMLTLAETPVGPLMTHVDLPEGYIDTAPDAPFDAACCLLTLHFRGPRRSAAHFAPYPATP